MSLSDLPTEIIQWIGGYLPSRYRAWLCFQDKRLHSIFASQFDDIETAVSEVLLWAAEAGDIDTMRLELKYKPEVNCEDSERRTPLSLAVQRGDIAMTRLLLEAPDVNIDQADADCVSPLSLALENGHATVTILLVAADARQVLGYRDVALQHASRYGQVEVLESLLPNEKQDPEFYLPYGDGESLLCSAAENGNERIVELYLDVGISPNAHASKYGFALFLASGRYDGVMKLLIEKGADVNMRNSQGQTALMRSAEQGFKAGVKILLAAEDINIDFEDVRGETALSLAARYKCEEYEEIVKLLREAAQAQNTQVTVQLIN